MTQASDLDDDLDIGLAHHEAGRLDEAAAIYRRILAADPDHAEALNLLGVILQDTGDLAQSIATLSRAVSVDPGFAEAFVNLARAHNAANDPAGAQNSSQQAIALDPDLSDAHLQRTRALLTQMDYEAAAAAARQTVALAPGSAEPHMYLGHALGALGDYVAAEKAYRAADEIAPDQFEVLLNLGMVLADLKQAQDAARYCRRAVALQPKNAQAHAALGVALHRAADIAGSVEAFDQALALAPDDPVIWRQQADNLSILGQFDKAADRYHRVLALDPSSSEALGCLATIGKLAESESERTKLQAALADGDRPTIERLTAGFALGKLLDTTGAYDAAFAAYAAANQLAQGASLKGDSGFDRANLRVRVKRLRQGFNREAFDATRGWGDPSDVPVFIVGMPRSGSTLIEQILASHPDVYGAGERKDIPDIVQRLDSQQSDLDPAGWDADVIRREAAAQCVQWQTIGGSAIRVIDKMPDNILCLGHIAVLFPNARVIFSRRDLRDVGLSCYFQSFRDGVDWAFDLADIAERACEIERLKEHWRTVLPLRMLDVDYETLVGDLEGQSRRMIDFLDLAWDDACLRFQDTERFVRTASFWQVRQPIYDSSVGRWQHYRPHIQPLLGGLVGVVPFEPFDVSLPNILIGACAHLDAGRTDAAAIAYRMVTDLEPDNAEALYGLGRLARERGDAERAIVLLDRVLAQQPGHVSAYLELARAYQAMGDLPAFAAAAGEAVKLDPASPPAHFLLGSALLEMGDAVGARSALEKAVALAPWSRDAQLNFATACVRLKQHETAIGALREAVRIRPNDVESLARLGRLLGGVGRHAEALPYLRRAIALAPQEGRVHLALVAVLSLAQDVEATAAACDEALRIAPDLAGLWLYDGYHKAAVGRFDEAKASFRKALSLDPDLTEARFAQTMFGEPGGDQDISRLRRMVEDSARDQDERVGAGFVLGDLLDRAGDYDAAWRAYDGANGLARSSLQLRGLAFDAADYDRWIEATIAQFPPAYFATTAGLGRASEVPVFIVGLPRSGTTLVEQIACSHPLVFGAGELNDIPDLAARWDTGPAPIEGDADAIVREAERYLERLHDLGGDATRVIDKMPDNFQSLGQIAVLFPQARIIVCRRDCRDTAVSCYAQNFGDRLPWTTNLAPLAARIHGFERLMKHWQAVLPLPMLEVRYEDLVGDLETQSRRLIDFLGLDWDPACLAFHSTERAVMTASQWQVRQPLFSSSVGRWRHYQPNLTVLLAGLAGLVPSDGGEDWDALAAEPAAALAIAASHHRAERLDYAEAIYRAVLRRCPDDPAALHLLGVLRCHRNEPADGVALISRSLALRPDIAPVLVDLGRALCAAGDPEAAEHAVRHALSLVADSPAALVQLGNALSLQGKAWDAAGVLQRALEIEPDSLEAWTGFAVALTERGDHLAAAHAWQTALQLRPNDPALLLAHASALIAAKQFDEALALFRKLDAAAPGQPKVRYGIAAVLLNNGDIAGAVHVCREALATTPDAPFWLLLANCEAIRGNFETAADAYRRAIALDPGMTGAMHDLAALGMRADDEATGEAARQVLADGHRPVRDRVAAGFTLGRLLDRYGDFDQAFDAHATANRLLREARNAHGFAFDRAGFRDLVSRQIVTIDSRTFAATAGWGDPSEAPVFVVGMPRSGTSLVEQIAASHSKVFGAGERMEIFALLRRLEGENVNCPPDAWDRASAGREAADYLQQLRQLAGDADRIIDKQPDNILALGQIAVLFPRARVIVCRRDLRDVGLSCHFQYFRDDPLVWTNDLADCGFRAAQIERLMDHWRAVLPIRVLEIQYETLIADLEMESRRLIDFLGLAWDPACLRFHETERAVMTASHWQVRQPVYASSAGRWRHYRHRLGSLLRELEGHVPADD
jgi:tetratricopeptide (TPR) repeat protein